MRPAIFADRRRAGVFRSANPGRPIPSGTIKGMDERQLHGDLRRRPSSTARTPDPRAALPVRRLQRCSSSLRRDRGPSIADAYDPQMRPLPTDQCAGSVAAQKKRVA